MNVIIPLCSFICLFAHHVFDLLVRSFITYCWSFGVFDKDPASGHTIYPAWRFS